MIQETDYRRLARYFAGECTDSERAETEAWLSADPSRRYEAEQLRGLWSASERPAWEPNTDVAWTRVATRLHIGDPAPLTLMPAASTPLSGKFRWRSSASRQWAIPALVSAAIVAASAVVYVTLERREIAVRHAPAATQPHEFRTARGQRAVIVLGDGSRVELGAASVLRFEESNGTRRVDLEGQAVFDVVHDTLRPFVVRSANAITEDLGTRFTVRAYRGESRVQVFVASGRVALRAVGSPSSSGTLLGPNDLGVLDSVGRATVRNGVDSTTHLAWTRDRFVFDNTRVGDIIDEVSRWFDVEIRVSDPAILERRITMNVPARSLSEVIGAVTAPLRLRSEKRGSLVVIQ